jgi:hypothetical protein
MLLGLVWCSTNRAAEPTPDASPPALPADVAADMTALKADIARLKGIVPDQSHAMKDVAYHFANLWFAAQHENWPLAEFYWAETRSHLRWAVRIIPVRKDPHASADGITPCPGTLGETPEHDRVSLESYGRGDRFARAEVDAQRAKGSSTGMLRCATEDISAPGDLKALKASHLDGCLQLCFQQSPGNSPRPEINMLSGRRGNRLLDQDVADLQAATRLEHPIHLAKYG